MQPIDYEKIVAYDIETLSNLITLCFYNIHTKNKKEFVLFDDSSVLIKLYKFLLMLRENDYTLVGFNCLNFDAQILEFFITECEDWINNETPMHIVTAEIYKHAQYIITLPEEERFQKLVPEFKLNIRHIDVFKQKHYDGKAKMGTSLKFIQVSIRYPNVEEMPIEHTTFVKKDQIPLILSYNWNDVLSTAAFFEIIKFETKFREELSQKYQINLLNASEPRIAKSIFAKFLCEDMETTYRDLRELKTFRHEIDLEKIIFPYIKFEDKELQNVLHIIKNTTTFPMGNEDDVTYTFKDPNIKLGKNPKKKKGESKKFEHFFKYADVATDVGLGGIHACCEPGVYTSSDDFLIHDIDVVSFYPNLAIKNDLKPEHLGGSFSKIYEQIFEQRKVIPKKDPLNKVYKIILNSTYGLSKEINCYLYDPEFTYSITINGQLSILMLVEMFWNRIPNVKIYQENTDGVTIGYHKQYKSEVEKICEEWSTLTKLTLEYNFYKKMIIVDVNNYIAVDKKNVSKKKGLFDTWDADPDKIEYHKNPSNLIVPKALEAFYVRDIDYKDFIRNHKDIFDFLSVVKKKKDFDLNLKKICGSEITYEPQQKVTRFYASKKGGRLVKDFKSGKKTGSKVIVLRDTLVTPLNKIEDVPLHFQNINYEFYIKETEKIIKTISPPSKNQLSLF